MGHKESVEYTDIDDPNVYKNIGSSDDPARKDQMHISKYISGLSEFISNCNTPMTISIQGSWGTGKTSIMKFVETELAKNPKIKYIEFNTWQFSQFGAADQLPFTLIASLIKQLQLKEDSQKRAFSKLDLAWAVLKAGTFGAAEAFLGSLTADALEALINGGEEAFRKARKENKSRLVTGADQVASALADLKSNFETCVNEIISDPNNDSARIVFFIDDLDRLEPKRAVELLEVLKLFMSCDGCVFVLAIDYDVVRQGVREKYNDIDKMDTAEFSKGDQFFEKIIQVPFKVPVSDYNIEEYVEQILKDLPGLKENEAQPSHYVDLLKNSIGTNPRSIKRAFNSFLLLRMIEDKDGPKNAKEDEILFSVVCLQAYFPGIYEYFVDHTSEIDQSLFNEFITRPIEELVEAYDDLTIKSLGDRRIADYLKVLVKDIMPETEFLSDLELLKKFLSISTITASKYNNRNKEEFEVDSFDDLTHLFDQEEVGREIDIQLKKLEFYNTDIHYMNKPTRSFIALKLSDENGQAKGNAYVNVFFSQGSTILNLYLNNKDIFKKEVSQNEMVENYLKSKGITGDKSFKLYFSDELEELVGPLVEACRKSKKG